MKIVEIGGVVLAAFVAGVFVASPELSALAANTVGSADIINESILSQDIKNGQVKSADLAANAVTSGKIKDGEIKVSDISPSFIKLVTLNDDAAGHAAGWNAGPDEPSTITILDSSIKNTSFVLANVLDNGIQSNDCGDILIRNGQFRANCISGDEGSSLHYMVINR